jgi:hypothetical protein
VDALVTINGKQYRVQKFEQTFWKPLRAEVDPRNGELTFVEVADSFEWQFAGLMPTMRGDYFWLGDNLPCTVQFENYIFEGTVSRDGRWLRPEREWYAFVGREEPTISQVETGKFVVADVIAQLEKLPLDQQIEVRDGKLVLPVEIDTEIKAAGTDLIAEVIRTVRWQ